MKVVNKRAESSNGSMNKWITIDLVIKGQKSYHTYPLDCYGLNFFSKDIQITAHI